MPTQTKITPAKLLWLTRLRQKHDRILARIIAKGGDPDIDGHLTVFTFHEVHELLRSHDTLVSENIAFRLRTDTPVT